MKLGHVQIDAVFQDGTTFASLDELLHDGWAEKTIAQGPALSWVGEVERVGGEPVRRVVGPLSNYSGLSQYPLPGQEFAAPADPERRYRVCRAWAISRGRHVKEIIPRDAAGRAERRKKRAARPPADAFPVERFRQYYRPTFENGMLFLNFPARRRVRFDAKGPVLIGFGETAGSKEEARARGFLEVTACELYRVLLGPEEFEAVRAAHERDRSSMRESAVPGLTLDGQ